MPCPRVQVDAPQCPVFLCLNLLFDLILYLVQVSSPSRSTHTSASSFLSPLWPLPHPHPRRGNSSNWPSPVSSRASLPEPPSPSRRHRLSLSRSAVNSKLPLRKMQVRHRAEILELLAASRRLCGQTRVGRGGFTRVSGRI